MADTPTTPAVPTITPDQAESFATLLERMSAQSKETSEHVKGLGTSIQEMLGLAAKKTEKEVESIEVVKNKLSDFRRDTQAQLSEMQKMHEEHGISVTGNLQKAAAAYSRAIEEIKSKVISGALGGAEAKVLLAEFEREAKEVNRRIADDAAENKKRGMGAQIGGAASASFGGGAGLGQATSSILSAIPAEIRMGGIAGLFLYGVSSEADTITKATNLAASFRTGVAQSAQDVVGNVGHFANALRNLSDLAHVTSGELTGIYETLRQSGVGFEEAGLTTQQLNEAFDSMGNVTIKGLTDNLGVLTLAMDKALNLQTGATAREAKSIARDLGIATGEAAEQFYKLSWAAKGSNEDIERYTSSVMVAARSLAQYGIDLSATTDLMEAFRAQDTLTHGALASKAIQGVGRMVEGIAGNEGMSAFIATEMIKRQGHIGAEGSPYRYEPKPGADINALEASRALSLSIGAGGKEGREALANMLRVVQDVAKTAAGGRTEQEQVLKGLFKVQQPTAAMIMDLTKEQIASIEAGKAPAGMTKEKYEELQKAVGVSRERENPFEQFVKLILAMIKDILAGILHFVAAGVSFVMGDGPGARKEIAVAAASMSNVMKKGAQAEKLIADFMKNAYGGGGDESKEHPTTQAMRDQQKASAAAAKEIDKQRKLSVVQGEKEFAKAHQGYVPVGSGGKELGVFGALEFEHDHQTGGRVLRLEVRDAPSARNASDRNQAVKSNWGKK